MTLGLLLTMLSILSKPPASDTVRLSVGSPLVNGRVYAPHAARVRVTVADSLRAEWTNQLSLGDSGGRRVMRWVTRGTRYQPGGDTIRWSILQTYDAVTLAPYGYRSTSTTGAEWQLVIQGRRVTGTRKLPGDTAAKPVDVTLSESGFIASASDLVPLAAGLKAGAVMTAPVWGPALADSELRIFSVLQQVPIEVEGSRVRAWKVEERRARDRALVATWYLTRQSPYMVYGEVPLPDGRVQRMTEVSIPMAPPGDSLRFLLKALADSTSAPGISVAVARDGKVLLASATGYADRERQIAATPQTVYRIGSVSKLLTVAAAARLAERRVLAWDADIRQLVPELPANRPVITARQLAGHTAGIRHYGPNEFINAVHHDSTASAVRAFLADSLRFAPGARYGYSSFGYVLLSLVLERAAHRPFLRLVSEEVLRPLGLRETGPDRPDSNIRNRAVPYDGGGGRPIGPAQPDDLSNRWAAGGFLSSVTDLVRFGSAFTRPGFLADSTLREMTTPEQLGSGAVSPVGIGWRIGKDTEGRVIWHHAGTALGGRAVLVVWPDERIVVALAGNLLFNQNERAAFRFADLIR